MKNRQKLTDDQLDDIAGGSSGCDWKKCSAAWVAKIEADQCPHCGGSLHIASFRGTVEIPGKKCNSCKLDFWYRGEGYWSYDANSGPFASSGGC